MIKLSCSKREEKGKSQKKKKKKKSVSLWYNYCDSCAFLLLFNKAISLIHSTIVETERERETLAGTVRGSGR